MKTRLKTIPLYILFIFISSCAKEDQNNFLTSTIGGSNSNAVHSALMWNGRIQEETVNKQLEFGWPKDILGLLEHLNEWDKEELAVYEQGDDYPNRKSKGETNGWIVEHKRLLKELGAIVRWNKKKMQYELRKK